MKLNPIYVGLLVFVIFIASILILSSISGSNNKCEDNSQTVGQYNLCIALQRCGDRFSGNEELRSDCITQIFYDIYSR